MSLESQHPAAHFYKAHYLFGVQNYVEALEHIQLSLLYEADDNKKGAAYTLKAKINIALGHSNMAKECNDAASKARAKK